MPTKIINIDLSTDEYLPIKTLVESLPYLNGTAKDRTKMSIVRYLSAIAHLHSMILPGPEKLAIVYFRFEQDMRKDNDKYIIKATLRMEEELDEVTLDDLE